MTGFRASKSFLTSAQYHIGEELEAFPSRTYKVRFSMDWITSYWPSIQNQINLWTFPATLLCVYIQGLMHNNCFWGPLCVRKDTTEVKCCSYSVFSPTSPFPGGRHGGPPQLPVQPRRRQVQSNQFLVRSQAKILDYPFIFQVWCGGPQVRVAGELKL